MDWRNLIADLIKAGCTQTEIAAACGASQASISDLYRGKTKSPSFALGNALIQLKAELVPVPIAPSAAESPTTQAQA